MSLPLQWIAFAWALKDKWPYRQHIHLSNVDGTLYSLFQNSMRLTCFLSPQTEEIL